MGTCDSCGPRQRKEYPVFTKNYSSVKRQNSKSGFQAENQSQHRSSLIAIDVGNQEGMSENDYTFMTAEQRSRNEKSFQKNRSLQFLKQHCEKFSAELSTNIQNYNDDDDIRQPFQSRNSSGRESQYQFPVAKIRRLQSIYQVSQRLEKSDLRGSNYSNYIAFSHNNPQKNAKQLQNIESVNNFSRKKPNNFDSQRSMKL